MSVTNSVLYKIAFFDKFIYSFVEKNLLPDILVHTLVNQLKHKISAPMIYSLKVSRTVWSDMFL